MNKFTLFATALLIGGGNLAQAETTTDSQPLLVQSNSFGSSADVKTLRVSDEKFTLEVQGAVGTEIKVRSTSKVYSYTPSTSGTVRFVGKNSKVYVYEGGAYKGTATESELTVTIPSITDDNVATSEDNLLSNASFETYGDQLADGKFKFDGSVWTSNVEPAEYGIRVGTSSSAKNGSMVLVWRGTGNSNYFSQKLSSLKANTKYKIQMSQVAGSNATASFNVGFGTSAGDLSIASSTVKLGKGLDGQKEVTITTPETIADGDVYFTFSNTSTNTASSGSDPVTQLDWISVVEVSAEAGIDGASSATYVANAAYAPNEVTYTSGAIYTEAIVNPSFETGSLAPWTAFSGGDTGVKPISNATYSVTNADGDYVFNTWDNAGATKFVKQTLTDLPDGYYTVTALIASDANNPIGLYAGDQSVSVAASSEGKTVAVEGTTTKAKVTDGTLEIGTTSNYWYKADNFRLTYYSQAAIDAEEVAANAEKLKGSSYSSPSDNLLVNGDCETANTGWVLNNMSYQANGLSGDHQYIETWQSGQLTKENYYATQSLRNMPKGVYVLKGTFHAENQSSSTTEITGVTINLNDKSLAISTPGSIGWKEYELFCNIEEDGDLKVTFDITNTNANWVGMDKLSLQYYGDYDAYVAAKLTDLKTSATTTLNNEAYTVVTGSERTTLKSLIDAGTPTTSAACEKAIDELNVAVNAFVAAEPQYTALQTAITTAESQAELKYASADKYTALQTAIKVTPSSSEDAVIKKNAVIAAQRAYIESNAKAEGVTGATDCTDKVTNANFSNSLEGWNSTQNGGNLGTLNGETWTNSDGTTGGYYYDYYNGDSNTQYGSQTVEGLTPGKYIVTVKARAQAGFAMWMLINDEETVSIEAAGNSGNIFDRGWNDYTAEFTVGSDGKVKIGVANKPESKIAGWFGFGDVRLYRIGDLDKATLSENETFTAEAKTVDVTLNRTLTTNWNTIVLPFALTADQVSSVFGEGTKVASFKDSSTEGTTTTLNFETAEAMEANVPYLIKPATAGSSYTISGATIVAATNDLTAGDGDIKFVGNYTNGKQLTAGNYYIDASANKFCLAKGTETMKAFRAIFVASEVASAKTLNFSVDGGTATGVEAIDAAAAAQTFDVYSVNGMLVKKNASDLSGLAKGVYIVNGKKYVAE